MSIPSEIEGSTSPLGAILLQSYSPLPPAIIEAHARQAERLHNDPLIQARVRYAASDHVRVMLACLPSFAPSLAADGADGGAASSQLSRANEAAPDRDRAKLLLDDAVDKLDYIFVVTEDTDREISEIAGRMTGRAEIVARDIPHVRRICDNTAADLNRLGQIAGEFRTWAWAARAAADHFAQSFGVRR